MDVCTKRSTYARLKASGSSVDEDKTNLRGDGPPRRNEDNLPGNGSNLPCSWNQNVYASFVSACGKHTACRRVFVRIVPEARGSKDGDDSLKARSCEIAANE
ncbi:hypothetical protein K0M31_010547 [Melipona bicolor]|uniref:Uncharacterized protein n=1 Tax=Melipona bicolor TaxID=60889 RepID=A0AA40FL98_9HYME|nr:hypothetical protein K0M31_010547 [Melipona bicolor]